MSNGFEGFVIDGADIGNERRACGSPSDGACRSTSR